MATRNRDKASDVLLSHPPLFGELTTFARAFPRIKELKAIIKETDGGRLVRTHYYSLTSPPGEFVDCSNPLCYNGGIRIGTILRAMESAGTTHEEAFSPCQGYNGSPKGRRRYSECDHWFDVTIDVVYKDPSEATKEGETRCP